MYNILITGVGEGGDKAVSIGGNGANNIVRYNTNGADTIRHMSERDLPEWLRNYNNGGHGNGHGVDLSWMNNGQSNKGQGLIDGNGNGNGFNNDGNANGNNIHYSQSDARNGDSNSTRYAWGTSGASIASASSSAGSSASDSSQPSESKAYEVTKQINELTEINYMQAIITILLTLFLLIVGYERKKHTEEG